MSLEEIEKINGITIKLTNTCELYALMVTYKGVLIFNEGKFPCPTGKDMPKIKGIMLANLEAKLKELELCK